MQPYNDADAPAIDGSVLARMKRLDKDLFVTFSKWAVDGESGRPITFRETGRPVYDPAYNLWIRHGDGRVFLVSRFPARQGFGHREVARLESSASRFMSPAEYARRAVRSQHEAAEREKAARQAARQDVLKANERRLGDLLFHGKSGRKDGAIVSYAGQRNRSRTQDSLSDAKADGWELPDNY